MALTRSSHGGGRLVFELDTDALAEALNTSDVGELVAATAAELAGVAATVVQSDGEVRRSYKSTGAAEEDGRQVARAYTDHIAGHIIEWGGATSEAHAPLRTAADRLGLELVEDPHP